MGTVPLQAPRLAVEELERCVRKLGLRAVEISTNVNGEELSEGGLGIEIIRAVTDEVEIEPREGGGSRLRFVKFLAG
jgi:anti-sigma regulatory factor (Ser/Thr protein kinase)